MAQPEPDQRRLNQAEFEKICEAIAAGHSVLVVGEAGSGTRELAQAVNKQFASDYATAIAIYKGSGKQFLLAIARQWDISTETEEGKALTVDQLKEEILANTNSEMLLIIPEGQRLSASVRYWLEDLLGNDARLLIFSPVNPNRGVFLELLEIELELPSDRQIRSVMEAEARHQGLTLTNSRLAALQPLAGRNPLLAKKVIRREKLGIQQETEHTQYIVIMPVVIALLFSFAILRFIGMGTGNKALYLVGGVCLVVAMALKQLGQVKGARKRLGQ